MICRVLLIYKTFWEWNIEDSIMETSYLFFYCNLSRNIICLLSYLSTYMYGGKHSIFYNTLPSIPVQEKRKSPKACFWIYQQKHPLVHIGPHLFSPWVSFAFYQIMVIIWYRINTDIYIYISNWVLYILCAWVYLLGMECHMFCTKNTFKVHFVNSEIKCYSWRWKHIWIYIYRYLYHRQSSVHDCDIEILFIHDPP